MGLQEPFWQFESEYLSVQDGVVVGGQPRCVRPRCRLESKARVRAPARGVVKRLKLGVVAALRHQRRPYAGKARLVHRAVIKPAKLRLGRVYCLEPGRLALARALDNGLE